MVETSAQKRAKAAHEAKLSAAGIKRVTLRLAAPARDHLAKLALSYGSKDRAASAAFEALLTNAATPAPAENPAPPASVTRGGKREAKRNDPKPLTPVPPTVPAETLGKAPQRAPARLSVDVPLVGTFVQKPMQKTGEGKR